MKEMSNKEINDCSVITKEDVEGFIKAFNERKPLSEKTQSAMNRARARADRIIAERNSLAH